MPFDHLCRVTCGTPLRILTKYKPTFGLYLKSLCAFTHVLERFLHVALRQSIRIVFPLATSMSASPHFVCLDTHVTPRIRIACSMYQQFLMHIMFLDKNPLIRLHQHHHHHHHHFARSRLHEAQGRISCEGVNSIQNLHFSLVVDGKAKQGHHDDGR